MFSLKNPAQNPGWERAARWIAPKAMNWMEALEHQTHQTHRQISWDFGPGLWAEKHLVNSWGESMEMQL